MVSGQRCVWSPNQSRIAGCRQEEVPLARVSRIGLRVQSWVGALLVPCPLPSELQEKRCEAKVVPALAAAPVFTFK